MSTSQSPTAGADPDALADLFHAGHIGGAAVDAFACEPLRDSPLRAPNVIAIPHIRAFTRRANAAMGTAVVRDVARILYGEHHSIGCADQEGTR